jgi:hypothetical protein
MLERIRVIRQSKVCRVAVSVLLLACASREQGAADTTATGELSSEGWIDVTATLDPARTPIYEGNTPLKFDFLKDMRKGDRVTLSAYSLGAHSGRTSMPRCISSPMERRSTRWSCTG